MSEVPGNAEPQLGIGEGKLGIGEGKLGIGEGKLGIGAGKLGIGEEKLGIGAGKLGIGEGKATRDCSVPGWHSRGYLPHYDSASVHQAITFRLADSLPQMKLRQLEDELKSLPDDKQNIERRKRIQDWLDAGMGCCALRHPAMASLLRETLQKFHGERYRLIAWCIMPNHVHVLIEPKVALARIVQSWKSFTGRRAMEWNAELGLGVPGKAFWMRDYWDRYIRNEKHFRQAVKYIHENPVKAGLCKIAKEWAWSSASSLPSIEEIEAELSRDLEQEAQS